MLKGLEISIVKYSEIDFGDRIDSEYFSKTSILINEKLNNKNSKKLRFLGDFVASAFYPAATQLYSVGDIPFVRCVDCINFPFITKEQDDAFEKIPLSFANENTGVNLIHKNDIVVTKVGSPCFASLIFEHETVALSRTVLGIKNIKNVNPFYLLVFLRCKYGFLQLLRARELTIQYQLTLERVRNILIFLPSEAFQIQIERMVKEAHSCLAQSKQLYSQAEDLLLRELGFKDWQPQNKAVSIKKFSDFAFSGRLDAEYYQSKYDEFFAILNKKKSCALGEIVSIRKSVEPGSEVYKDSGIPFVRVSDVTKFGIEETGVFLSPNDFNLDSLKPKKDTILLSKDGSIGIAYKIEKNLDVITSGALLHLSIINENCLPDYLTLVLNSVVVKLQSERDSSGAIIQHWKQSDIQKVIIPLLTLSIQKEIAQLVQKSFSLKAQSNALLQKAKQAVEEEIEAKK